MILEYRAFVGEGDFTANGNVCTICLCDEKSLHINEQDFTLCTVWRPSCQSPLYEVSCSQNGYCIECCGHGLLCAAASILSTQTNRASLRINGNIIPAKLNEGKIWLRFTKLSGNLITLPSWINQAFHFINPISNQCIQATEYGGEQGYLLLEWPPMTDLTQMNISSAVITQFTQRAVICVAKGEWQALVKFRYFAPQYGVAEDMATGSAARVVAAHFGGKLTLHQVSSSGGLMYSNEDAEHVEIGGLCQPI
ncbi:PhzF family phenazine biosynthesis protein [Vibrio sp. S4M6]|uniref:PhzF family phenazine biosynthesis protein n=1 Tax=Vibrio sinus TaxID=2946865 RepID=UPI002029F722|nr:PhzF family phenazine biosynthesis protein [Vibrio sinus]MCL9783472.1 PhzF family phenazine biosynthesis protein [Vibrio sinus]